MRPDDMRSVMADERNAKAADIGYDGSLGQKLDQLSSRLSSLDSQISTVFARLDPVLLPNDPKEQDIRGPEPVKEMSHAARFVDEQIDRLVSMESAIASLLRRIDL